MYNDEHLNEQLNGTVFLTWDFFVVVDWNKTIFHSDADKYVIFNPGKLKATIENSQAIWIFEYTNSENRGWGVTNM